MVLYHPVALQVSVWYVDRPFLQAGFIILNADLASRSVNTLQYNTYSCRLQSLFDIYLWSFCSWVQIVLDFCHFFAYLCIMIDCVAHLQLAVVTKGVEYD